MGLSGSTTTKTETKPIYEQEIKQAYANQNAAYSAQAPKITAITDQLSTLTPGLLDRYTNGDAGVNAARDYNTSVINGDYLKAGNPWLDSIVSKAGNDARNQTAAALGVRGLNGGSTFNDNVSRNILNAENSLYSQNYNTERDRQQQAASLAPTLSSAQYQPLDALFQIANSQALPLQAASGNSAATGGLLGQYTKGTQTQTVPFGSLLAGVAGTALGGWASGGFKGI